MSMVSRRTTRRRGAFAAIELTVATILLVVAMTLAVQALGWVAAERRATERRAAAVREAANLMERLTARPFDQITPEARRRKCSPNHSGKRFQAPNWR